MACGNAAASRAPRGALSGIKNLPALERRLRGKLRAPIFPQALREPNARDGPSVQGGRNVATGFERHRQDERPDRSDRGERSEYGPPPGYQPIILPENRYPSIRGWRRTSPRPSVRALRVRAPEARTLRLKEKFAPASDQPAPPLPRIFATDEPLFADSVQAPLKIMRKRAPRTCGGHSANSERCRDVRMGPQQKRLHEMNVAAVFGREEYGH